MQHLVIGRGDHMRREIILDGRLPEEQPNVLWAPGSERVALSSIRAEQSDGWTPQPIEEPEPGTEEAACYEQGQQSSHTIVGHVNQHIEQQLPPQASLSQRLDVAVDFLASGAIATSLLATSSATVPSEE